jgi:hypothetical protein
MIQTINKFIPYFYFTVALLLLFNSFQKFFADLEEYNILFSWNTESKITYISMRILLVLFVVMAGIMRLKRLKNQE